MDNYFTIPQELKGTKGDILAARIEVPIIIGMIYGIVAFVRLGWSKDHYLYTYGPVLGGVAASVGLFTYFFVVSVERKRRRKNLLALLGFLPYFYGLSVLDFFACSRSSKASSASFHFWRCWAE